MTSRERLALILNGKATKELLDFGGFPLSGAWVGHVDPEGQKLYLTTEGAY